MSTLVSHKIRVRLSKRIIESLRRIKGGVQWGEFSGMLIITEISNLGGTMNFNELLESRRSIRNYQDKPVSLETIKEMIKESTLAPSSGNGQPWKFIIVNNKEMMKRISDESKKNILARINANPEDSALRYKGMLENESFNVFYNAPSLVIVLGRSDLKNVLVDCASATTYFMMAAVSRGLGTCWVNLGAVITDPELKNELGIPDNFTIVAPVIVGYPEKIPAAPKRNEPEILKIIT